MARHREFDKGQALQKAMEVFWQQGYEATSVSDLLDAMEIHRGSMYDTFGDKHSLYLEALEYYRERAYQSYVELFEAYESPYDAIKRLLKSMVEPTKSRNRQRGCFINNAMVECATDPQVAMITSKNSTLIISLLSTMIAKAQQQNEMRADVGAESLAQFLFTTMQGIKVMSKNGASETMLKNIIDVTLLALESN